MPFTVSPCCPLACKPLLCLYSEGFQSLRRLQENQGVMRVDPGGRNTLRRGPSCTGMFLARPGHFGPCDLCLAYCKLTAGKGMSSNCPNWSDRLLFLRVLTGISYDLRTFGISSAFSDGIRPSVAFLKLLDISKTLWIPAQKHCRNDGVRRLIEVKYR